MAKGVPALVVSQPSGVSRAKEYLVRRKIRGHVEVASAHQYFNREYTLLERLKASAPPGFARTRILWEFVTHDVPCPVVRIQLGFRDRVRKAVASWAALSLRRYGRDRVVTEYFVSREPL
jgi:hypothetical protein